MKTASDDFQAFRCYSSLPSSNLMECLEGFEVAPLNFAMGLTLTAILLKKKKKRKIGGDKTEKLERV